MQIIELMREGIYFTGEAKTQRRTYWFMTDAAGQLMKVDREFDTHDPNTRGWLCTRSNKRPRGLQEAVLAALAEGSDKSICRPGSVAAKKLREKPKH